MMLPHALADKTIAEASLPTDGKNILPISADTVRTLIAKAVQEDRQTEEPDFDAIADKVLLGSGHGQHVHKTIVCALRYAQSLGARFKEAGPAEEDYAEAVGDAVEAFCTTLKSKGYLHVQPIVERDEPGRGG